VNIEKPKDKTKRLNGVFIILWFGVCQSLTFPTTFKTLEFSKHEFENNNNRQKESANSVNLTLFMTFYSLYRMLKNIAKGYKIEIDFLMLFSFMRKKCFVDFKTY